MNMRSLLLRATPVSGLMNAIESWSSLISVLIPRSFHTRVVSVSYPWIR